MDPNSSESPCHWSEMILIFPGSVSYDPSIPRVYKWNQELVCITGDFKTFVDDLRSIDTTWEICCEITHWVETMMGYLGFQDATGKRRTITQSPDEWTGAIIRAIEGIGFFDSVI